MSLEETLLEFNKSEFEFQIAVSDVLIPFSKSDSEDIYTGDELIPFAERIPEYQEILIKEFLHV
jgi:hypothetical protein